MTEIGTGAAWERARALLRGRLMGLTQIVFVVLIPFQLVQFALIVIGLRGSDNSRLFSLTTGHVVVYAVSLWLAVSALMVAIAGCHRLLTGGREGEPPADADAALRATLARLGSIVAVAALVGAAVTLGTVLFVLPGIWCAVTFALAMPALLLDDVRGTRALARARELASEDWGGLFRGLAPAGLLLCVAIAVVAIAINAFFGGEVTIGSAFVQIVGNLLVSAALTPPIAALVHLAYLERTGAVETPVPTPAPPALPSLTGAPGPAPPGSVAPPRTGVPEPDPEPSADDEAAAPSQDIPAGERPSIAPPPPSVGPPGPG